MIVLNLMEGDHLFIHWLWFSWELLQEPGTLFSLHGA
jgi:hypothetical protein